MRDQTTSTFSIDRNLDEIMWQSDIVELPNGNILVSWLGGTDRSYLNLNVSEFSTQGDFLRGSVVSDSTYNIYDANPDLHIKNSGEVGIVFSQYIGGEYFQDEVNFYGHEILFANLEAI